MKIAPYPSNETERIAELEHYGILDTPADSILDSIAQTAADVCGTNIALVSLIDRKRQFFKSNIGLPVRETHRNLAFCSHAILEPDKVLEIQDSMLDARFYDNPLVTDGPKIRFYAGKPLVTPNGYALGTLCVIDEKPLKLNAWQENALRRLARIVSDLLDERREIKVSANDDMLEQIEPIESPIVAPYRPSANTSAWFGHELSESKSLQLHRLRTEYRCMVEGLTSIVSSAIQFDLDIEPMRLISFIDFYCVYLTCILSQGEGSTTHSSELPAVPLTFLEFIFNQTLLNEMATIIEAEEGGRVNAPAALQNPSRP